MNKKHCDAFTDRNNIHVNHSDKNDFSTNDFQTKDFIVTGDESEAIVLDTLDIAERALLCINALTNNKKIQGKKESCAGIHNIGGILCI